MRPRACRFPQTLGIEARIRLGRRKQRIQQSLFRSLLGRTLNLSFLFLGNHSQRQFSEIANNRFHVPTHVAHLGEFRSFDLDERSLGKTRESASDLRLPDPGGSDHDDVLRRDLVSQFFGNLLPAPTIAQGNRNRSLCFTLTDDIPVEFRDDFSRCKGPVARHGRVTWRIESLV